MNGTLFALLVGCAPQPAEVKLDGDPTAVVYTLDSISLPGATVLDKKGVAISPAPPINWSVNDAAVATVDQASGKVTPVAEGTAIVTATAGQAKADWKVRVILPDSVEITGAAEGQTLPLGTDLALTAELKDASGPITGQTITWASSDAALATVADGKVTPVAVGKVTITATWGTLNDTAEIEVVEAATLTDAAPAGATGDI